MRVLSLNVYSFNELSEEAQKKAWENYVNSNHFEYIWVDEGIKSIRAFANAFGIGLKDYEISTYGRSFITTDANNDAFRGISFDDAIKLIDAHEDGYCIYYDLKQKFIDAVNGNGNIKGAFEDAIEAGLKSIKSDMEHQETFEYYKDMVDANDYEFYENGTLI
jgi:hypothetical protein